VVKLQVKQCEWCFVFLGMPNILSSGHDTFHWFRVVVQSITSNRSGELSQILQIESVVNP
jgi:hypothetical protein